MNPFVIELQLLLRFLVFGSDKLRLPASWLADVDRLAAYEAYTKRQRWQGVVVADVAEMRRRAFWVAIAAKRQPAPKLAFSADRVSQR